MIPLRISLTGFLCYKDVQEVSFDSDATLWMLSGLNGSGKSSIFDAVTYALFGYHRGGSQHAVELINKDSDGMSIEFDFRLDNQVYRVRRTLKRTAKGASSATQQLYCYEANDKKNWRAVEGSNYKKEFEGWISDKIGLTYETFTSSVLLLQGKAEKLLGSKPEERRAVLASIVDLERYERLYDKADAKRKELKAKLEGLSDRLAALPEVKPEQVIAAEQSIQAAEEAREQCQAEVERLREMEHQAQAWLELQSKLAAARQRWQRAGQLLQDAASIEGNLERLRQLREVLPRLREIVKQRGTIRDAELAAKGLLQEKEKTKEKLLRCEGTLQQERDKRAMLQKHIESEEKQRQELEPQLHVVIVQMEKLTEHERQSAELTDIRAGLGLLPSNADEEASRARMACEELAALAQLLPQLVRFQELRAELRQAQERNDSAKERQAQVEANGKHLNAERKRLEPLVKEADHATRQAKDQETEARTLLKQAQDSLREITELEGAKRCRHCAQELPPGHIQDQIVRRGEEVQLADEQLKKAATVYQAAQKEEQRLREEAKVTQENYQEAREEYREATSQANQARNDVARQQSECVRAYDELPEEQRRRIGTSPIADWLTTEYPLRSDLDQLRSQATGYPSARQRLHKAEEVHKQWTKLKTQEADKLATLHRLQAGLPADREAVRKKHTDHSVRLETLDKNLMDKRGQLKDADTEIESWTSAREHWRGQRDRIDLELKKKEVDGQKAKELIAVNQKTLPASWQSAAESAGAAEYNQWDKERADLEASGVDQHGKELQEARHKLDLFRQDKESLESQQAVFPEEVRRDPVEIKKELEKAREVEKQREKDVSNARHQLAQLERDCEQREQIGKDFVLQEGELSLYKTLSELLGKNRLQLYLVRQAEKEVVEYANAVLDRLSGGQLYLKLRGETEGESGSDRALDLEAYNRVTGERPINVAFLSGSQKFRVAVSLALGIGQYASRQHRPIESVIIDEGFGCLDSQGRQVMIQELQNLRSQMRCILLVSHQEDFAEAFSDGYHFELEAGATRIKRFQK